MRRGRVAAAIVAGIAMGLLLAACGGGREGAAGGDRRKRVDVVASFYPVAEVATRVGGDLVRVTNLTPAGVEPHDLELTSRQVDHVEDADLVVHVGEGFQPALADAVKRRGKGTIDVLAAVGA